MKIYVHAFIISIRKLVVEFFSKFRVEGEARSDIERKVLIC